MLMRIDWLDIAFSLSDPLDFNAFNIECVKKSVIHQLTPSDYVGRIMNVQEKMRLTGERDYQVAYYDGNSQSVGLGDTIAKITHATGLDKLSELYTQITGKPCGCAERQEALNKLFPYGVKEENGN